MSNAQRRTFNLERLIGWKLDEAQVSLAQDESTRGLAVRLIETAAPLRRNQTIEERDARLGAWRVLCASFRHNAVEVIVAREQIID